MYFVQKIIEINSKTLIYFKPEFIQKYYQFLKINIQNKVFIKKIIRKTCIVK